MNSSKYPAASVKINSVALSYIKNFKIIQLENYYAELSRIDNDIEKNAEISDNLWESVIKDNNISEFK